MALGAMQLIDAQGRLVRSYDVFQETPGLEGLELGIYFLLVGAGEDRMLMQANGSTTPKTTSAIFTNTA